MKIRQTFIILLSLLFTQSSWAETIFKATYVLKWGNTSIGNVKRQLDKNGDIYTFTSNAKPKGLAVFLTKGIAEKSVFKVANNKLIPLSYFYDQRGKRSKQVQHDYNFAKKVLTISKPKSLVVQNISKNTVDALNSQYMVMLGLAKGLNKFNVVMYDDSKTPKKYGLYNSGKVKMKVPAGTFNTVLIQKLQDGPRKFNLWCAPNLNYLPVKISYTNKKGQVFTMDLLSID